jgi:uncharacterized RDD family membrane protein YckC
MEQIGRVSMTEQQGPPPAQPPPPAPPPAAPPPAGESWQSAPPPAQPTQAASGLVYADVPNRAVAYIIDAIILFVINLIVAIIVGSFLPAPTTTNIFNQQPNYAAVLITTLIGLAINGAYFVYTWTQMRGSPGQRILGMQVGNAADGATLTQEQAIRRWIFLGAPFGLASALNPLPAVGLLIGLAGLAYFIFLLVSTAQSPTKQGFHDKQANTVVVKAARSVG